MWTNSSDGQLMTSPRRCQFWTVIVLILAVVAVAVGPERTLACADSGASQKCELTLHRSSCSMKGHGGSCCCCGHAPERSAGSSVSHLHRTGTCGCSLSVPASLPPAAVEATASGLSSLALAPVQDFASQLLPEVVCWRRASSPVYWPQRPLPPSLSPRAPPAF